MNVYTTHFCLLSDKQKKSKHKEHRDSKDSKSSESKSSGDKHSKSKDRDRDRDSTKSDKSTASSHESSTVVKNRPKTVKTAPSKFRSTGNYWRNIAHGYWIWIYLTLSYRTEIALRLKCFMDNFFARTLSATYISTRPK